jgi:tripartite-type tricarboxylate transporter receptor subunit TctC
MNATRAGAGGRLFIVFVFSLLTGMFPHQAQSQSQSQPWPTRPVNFIVSTSPGTASDILARLMASRLSTVWKQPIVVDNRTGAGGAIAMGYVAKAKPDGYNILFTPNTITMIGALSKSIDWDVVQSFTPVSLIARTLTVVVVNTDLPAKNVADVMELARSQPGKLNYASPGVGTPQHLFGELFKQAYSLNVVHVPYKTSAGAVTDMAAGTTQFGFFALGTIMPMVKTGKLRILAASSEQRSSFVPDVPTFNEAGIGKIQASNWVGTFMPRQMPADVVERVARDFAALLADSGFQRELHNVELIPNPSTGSSQEFAATVKFDAARWKKVVVDANIVTE